MNPFLPSLNHLLDIWLNEDIGRGDLSSPAIKNCVRSAHWIAKKPGVFCGGPLVKEIFKRLDPSVDVHLLMKEGESCCQNQRLIELEGSAQTLLLAERTALNIVMHLSGIATATSHLVKELEGTGVKLADTRKTTPGLRVLEKYAVRCGGGLNHRLGLDDTAMLKENHLAWSENIQIALDAIRAQAPWPSRIIVEAETAEQAKEAVIAGADGVLLDEIPAEKLHKLVPQLRQLAQSNKNNQKSRQIIIEASGVDATDLKAFASTGVDLISTSAPITRSHWLDISMRFEAASYKPKTPC